LSAYISAIAMSADGTATGFFITFEGPEGSGKSTQSHRLMTRLNLDGLLTTREPGGTELGEQIRATLLSARRLLVNPWSEALLFTAARAQHVEELIRPRLAAGQVVICDRFSDSTIAYQGYGRGLDRALLARLQEVVTLGARPDLTFLLDLPVEEGLRRIPLQARDRLDSETRAFHRRVRDGYLHMAAEEPQRWITIDASRHPDEVADQVLEVAVQRLRSAGKLPAERTA
jgi:dTMP kinase